MAPRGAARLGHEGIRTYVLQTPYELSVYAGEHLVPLDGVLDPAMVEAEYGEQWRDRMQGGTGQYQAVVVKATLKSLMWYTPAAFAERGYTAPSTWDELGSLSESIRAAGDSPWCLGVESTPSSGWPGTDWVEDILLHQSGPAIYEEWASGELAWTSPEVSDAWQAWGELIAQPGAVNGGPHAALVTNFGEAGRPLFDSPAGCYLHHAASFIRGTYTQYGDAAEADFVSFPTIAPEHADTHVVAADLMVMFRDTPAAAELINFVASAEAQAIWPGLGTGAISVNAIVPDDVYADDTSQRTAEILTDPEAVMVFDGSDQMPADLREAFNQAVLRYLAAPEELEAILSDLERVRQQAYEP